METKLYPKKKKIHIENATHLRETLNEHFPDIEKELNIQYGDPLLDVIQGW